MPASASASPRLKPPHRHREPCALLFLLAFVCPLLVFGLLAYGVQDGGTFGFDRELVAYFDAHYYDFRSLRRVTEAFVYAGVGVGAAVVVLALVVLLRLKRRRQALIWALTVAGVAVIAPALKLLFQRPQIGEPGEYSFPSGNATASMAMAVSAFLLLPRSRRRPLAALAGLGVVALYGFALVVLLWHYPSDVLAGWCVALAWVTALWLALGRRTVGCNSGTSDVNTR